MATLFKKHKMLWVQPQFIATVFLGAILFTMGLVATYYANAYTLAHASNVVTDIILDNLPIVNVDFLFSEGAVIFTVITAIICLYEPRRIPFALKSIALFSIIRAAFTMLTHTAPPFPHSFIDPQDILFKLSSGNDLFFSEHTGLPFLFAFIFWDEKYLRYLFLTFTVIGAVTVLLGHLHYSIDVFSALFISFGIYHMSKSLFRKDFELLKKGSTHPKELI